MIYLMHSMRERERAYAVRCHKQQIAAHMSSCSKASAGS
ncbi:MAG: hypothetical protein RL341_1398 [Pseudomonadota bacterium]|jgi:hypothetical protein